MMPEEFEEYRNDNLSRLLRMIHTSEESILNGIAALFGDEAAYQCRRGYVRLRLDFFNLMDNLTETEMVDGKLVYAIVKEFRTLRMCELEFNALYDSYNFDGYKKRLKDYAFKYR